MELMQQISVEHTRKIFGGKIELMFYDVTTLSLRLPRQMCYVNLAFQKKERLHSYRWCLGCLYPKEGIHCCTLSSTEANMRDSR